MGNTCSCINYKLEKTEVKVDTSRINDICKKKIIKIYKLIKKYI